VAAKMLDGLREPHHLDGHEVNVSCSIGIAVYPQDGRSEAALLRAADAAAYHAKQFRNTWQRYSVDMQRTQPEALLAFGSLRRAIETGQLEVHYQPQLHARTRALHGFEALVRWREPVEGLKSTTQLIQAAEDAGMIAAVTDFVLGASMRQMLQWDRRGFCGGAHLAVNISGVQIRDGALIPMLERHLRETGFPASRLELEITETTAMRSDASTAAVLMELRRLGIRLAVDDFGTGYSSLSRLQRLPVDALKIDQSFVHGIEQEGDGGALAQAIIVMAHSLHLAVTAEGVETPGQLAFLQARDCDRLQGYLLSPPLTAIDVERCARRRPTWPSGELVRESLD
jgi:EAL domain-containing protein (putative c-di-GMP-specific phosphodiesterase class I)